jgi:hypothetical protein
MTTYSFIGLLPILLVSRYWIGQPPCCSITSSISRISRMVSPRAITIFVVSN